MRFIAWSSRPCNNLHDYERVPRVVILDQDAIGLPDGASRSMATRPGAPGTLPQMPSACPMEFHEPSQLLIRFFVRRTRKELCLALLRNGKKKWNGATGVRIVYVHIGGLRLRRGQMALR